jgi:hypothetical protein
MNEGSENRFPNGLNRLLEKCPDQDKAGKILNIGIRILNFDERIKENTDKKNHEIITYRIAASDYCAKFRLFEKEDTPRLYLKLPRFPKLPSGKPKQVVKLLVETTDDWSDALTLSHIPERRARISTKKSSGPYSPSKYENYINQYMPNLQKRDNFKLEMLVDLACEILRNKSLYKLKSHVIKP